MEVFAMLPAPTFARPGPCAHPSITDAALDLREQEIHRTWGSVGQLKCPDCNEWLYPHEDQDEGWIVFVGEPFGAGADAAGRPSASTHPEYWTE